jgi:hypothetical protein
MTTTASMTSTWIGKPRFSDTGYIPTFSMQIWGELEEFYCHAQDCACDDATQCWSGMCVNGYCS